MNLVAHEVGGVAPTPALSCHAIQCPPHQEPVQSSTITSVIVESIDRVALDSSPGGTPTPTGCVSHAPMEQEEEIQSVLQVWRGWEGFSPWPRLQREASVNAD